MRARPIARLAGLALLLGLPAGAQAWHDFQGMQSDMMLLQAIQQMAQTYGPGCQMGAPAACQAYEMVIGTANQMQFASDACLQGNQQACEAYFQNRQFMAQAYDSFSTALAAGSGGGGIPGYDPMNPLGPTHADRMGAIAQFGADAQAGHDERMRQMDIQHQRTLDMIRQ